MLAIKLSNSALLSSVCSNSVDLALVLDMSGSTDDSHDLELYIARHLVERLAFQSSTFGGGSRVALVTFADSSIEWFALDTYNDKTNLLEAFNIVVSVKEGTDTQSALTLMQSDVFNKSRGDRPGVNNVAVVITDGRSNIRQDRTLPAAAAARNAGITIYAIGVGDVNVPEVSGIAGSATNYRLATNEHLADDAVSYIANRLCTPWY
jgi:collagen type VI alpha